MKLAILALCLTVVAAHEEFQITTFSVIKLISVSDGSRLHSHDVKYGSGSGQQSVTAVKTSDDVNSHWQVLPELGKDRPRGDVIHCDDVIRLKHLQTGHFLHSHHFDAPLSKGNQEVSCFGGGDKSDTGDNWKVICSSDDWYESEQVKLKHVDTEVYLSLSGQQYGRPISGQREVVGSSNVHSGSSWKTAEGIYIKHQEHTEH